MAAHVPTQPTGVALSTGTNLSFLSGLQIQDRSFYPDLIEKYGTELYAFFLGITGKKVRTENETFYHYEKRRLMQPVQVASVTGGTAGATAAVTIAAGSHYDSGSKSPIRVGEVYMISASGILGKVLSVNKASAGAHVANIAPVKSAQAFNPAANDWLLPQGRYLEGENSSDQDGISPIVDKVTNTVTEVREDYRITDKALMEKVEWVDPYTKQNYYRRLATGDAEKRFLLTAELLTVFSDDVTNSNITSKGTKGMLAQITSGGSDLSYTANSMAIADFQTMTRTLTFNGAAPELHHLADVYQYQEIQKLLFTTYPNGAIMWGSVGGSKEAAAAYGFQSLAIDGFTFHFKKYAPFSPEWVWGVAPASTPNYRNFGVVIPQGFSTVVGNNNLPTICLRYQSVNGQEVMAWETGAFADSNKTAAAEVKNHLLAYYGVQVTAANQCVIFNG